MNIEEYISSGILELYATGALPAAEKAEVEKMAHQHPAIETELNQITHTLNQYVLLHAVTPPTHLREKILKQIAQPAPATKTINPENLNFNPINEVTQESKVISIDRGPSETKEPLFNWLVAAALALLVVSNALSFFFYKNWKDSEQSLALALASQQQYADNIQQVRQQLSQNEQALALLTNQETLKVPLKGVNKSPNAQVVVYWHRPSRHLILDLNTLPVPPAGKQYQLWALDNGKPIDAGLINFLPDAKENLQSMKNVTAAQAFAITLEPQGGSVNPTLNEMVVMGQI